MGPATDRVPLCLLLLVLVAACTSSTTSVTSPTSTRCPVNLGAAPAAVGATGGSGQITIGVNPECTWQARSEASWLALSAPTSGQGDGRLSFSASPNEQVSARRGAVVVNEQRIELEQAAAACAFALDRAGASVDADGGALVVTVSAQASCAWTAVSQAGWIRVDSGREGDGRGSVTIRIDGNAGPARTGTVLVAGQSYAVSQAGAPPTGPPPPPGCTFAVSPTSEAVGSGGAERDVRVQATRSNCPWTAASNAPWIAVTNSGGRGNGSVRYMVAPNTGAPRAGSLIVAGTMVTVTQEAGAPTSSSITLRGEMSNLSGRCPDLTFKLEGRSVRTSDRTSIEGNCDRLRNGRDVEVTGQIQADGWVLALRVRVDD